MPLFGRQRVRPPAPDRRRWWVISGVAGNYQCCASNPLPGTFRRLCASVQREGSVALITELTRRDLIDFIQGFDPAPMESMLGARAGGNERRLGLQWWGRLEELDFLSRLYDLESLPSSDDRFATAREDIVQHRYNNDDWDDAWVFTYPVFELESSDDRLLTFLAETLHPAVRGDRSEVERLRSGYNRLLRRDRLELVADGQVSGRPTYIGGPAVARNVQPDTLREAIGQTIRHAMSAYQVEAFCDELMMPPLSEGSYAAPMSSKAGYVCERLDSMPMPDLEVLARQVLERHHNDELADLLFEIDLASGPRVAGAPKNLIFGAVGAKPDLVLADAVNNEIRIVGDASTCLVYDRAIDVERGLSFAALVDWWQGGHPSASKTAAAKALYDRLCLGLNDPERAIMDAYRDLLREHGFGLTAIVPQVYLHYDPKTIRERLAADGKKLERQRMDFLLLLPRCQRIVVELDGKEHYSDRGEVRPARYAAMVREDRRLRLQGYEVYRFGGHEFVDLGGGKELARLFFEELLRKHGAIA